MGATVKAPKHRAHRLPLLCFSLVSFRLVCCASRFVWVDRPYQLSARSRERGSGVGNEESWSPTGRGFQRGYSMIFLPLRALLTSVPSWTSTRKLALLLAPPGQDPPRFLCWNLTLPQKHFLADGLLSVPKCFSEMCLPVSAPCEIYSPSGLLKPVLSFRHW